MARTKKINKSDAVDFPKDQNGLEGKMAAVDPKEAMSSAMLNLSGYKEPAIFLLTFCVPPAAIAVRQGKDDLESRHLALSLALYLSVICYLPAVVHAYWLLYVRDNGGVEECARLRLKQAQGYWNEHGGVVKTQVDKYSPMVVGKLDAVRDYAAEKVTYVANKRDETLSFTRETIATALDVVDDGREAYRAGKAIDWAKEKMRDVVEKVKTLLEPYPHLQTLFNFVEQRVLHMLEIIAKIFESFRSKVE